MDQACLNMLESLGIPNFDIYRRLESRIKIYTSLLIIMVENWRKNLEWNENKCEKIWRMKDLFIKIGIHIGATPIDPSSLSYNISY